MPRRSNGRKQMFPKTGKNKKNNTTKTPSSISSRTNSSSSSKNIKSNSSKISNSNSSRNASSSSIRKKSIQAKKLFQLSALGTANIRIKASGKLKATQMTQRGKNLLEKNPKLVKDFLSILTTTKIKGFARKNALVLEAFDPHDKSRFHSGLFKMIVKGKNFLVKEVSSQAFPYNPHSQFVLHQKLQKINPHLKKFNCEVVPYIFAWEGKATSFLVSPFVKGITLEKWVSEKPEREKSDVFMRFIKASRILSNSLGIKDVTTRNVIYNPRTGKLTFFDLMPPK
jgi:hypothetical protein